MDKNVQQSEPMASQVKYLKNKLLYPYDLIIGCYFLCALFLAEVYDFRFDFRMLLNFKYDAAFLFIIVLSACCFETIVFFKGLGKHENLSSAWSSCTSRVAQRYFTPRKIYEILRVLFLLKFVLLIYCNIKQAIPRINPGGYDEELLQLDAILHFGVNPNIAAVKLLGDEFIVMAFDQLYFFWYLLKAPILVFFLVVPGEQTRVRFFGSYFSMWIFGGLLAVILPSYGPVYLSPEIFVHLEKTIAHTLQDNLMVHYRQLLADPEGYRYYMYEGIAAFPSLHVGVVALFSFFLYQVHRLSGVLMALYTLCVLMGSVLLGWHYAVDGYFAILLAYLIFRLSQRWEMQPAGVQNREG